MLFSPGNYSALTPDDVHAFVTFTAAGMTNQQNRLPSPAAMVNVSCEPGGPNVHTGNLTKNN